MRDHPLTRARNPEDSPAAPDRLQEPAICQPLYAPDAAVSGGLVHGVDVTEQKLARQAPQHSAQHFRFLSDMANQLLSADDPRELIRALFQRISAELGLEIYLNYLVNEDNATLRLNCHAGMDEQLIEQLRELKFGQGPCGHTAQQRRPLIANNIAPSSDPLNEMMRGFGIASYACHPLIAQDRLMGTLAFASRVRTAFSDEELALVETLCKHVAVAIQRRQMMDALRDSAERYRVLYEHNPTLYLTLDTHGQVLSANQALHDLLGDAIDEVVGQSVMNLLHRDDVSPNQPGYPLTCKVPNTLPTVNYACCARMASWYGCVNRCAPCAARTAR